jgi:hypothetical protein
LEADRPEIGFFRKYQRVLAESITYGWRKEGKHEAMDAADIFISGGERTAFMAGFVPSKWHVKARTKGVTRAEPGKYLQWDERRVGRLAGVKSLSGKSQDGPYGTDTASEAIAKFLRPSISTPC